MKFEERKPLFIGVGIGAFVLLVAWWQIAGPRQEARAEAVQRAQDSYDKVQDFYQAQNGAMTMPQREDAARREKVEANRELRNTLDRYLFHLPSGYLDKQLFDFQNLRDDLYRRLEGRQLVDSKKKKLVDLGFKSINDSKFGSERAYVRHLLRRMALLDRFAQAAQVDTPTPRIDRLVNVSHRGDLSEDIDNGISRIGIELTVQCKESDLVALLQDLQNLQRQPTREHPYVGVGNFQLKVAGSMLEVTLEVFGLFKVAASERPEDSKPSGGSDAVDQLLGPVER